MSNPNNEMQPCCDCKHCLNSMGFLRISERTCSLTSPEVFDPMSGIRAPGKLCSEVRGTEDCSFDRINEDERENDHQISLEDIALSDAEEPIDRKATSLCLASAAIGGIADSGFMLAGIKAFPEFSLVFASGFLIFAVVFAMAIEYFRNRFVDVSLKSLIENAKAQDLSMLS